MTNYKPATTEKIAYLYIRFSDERQKSGTSEARQEELGKAWCKANGYTLADASIYRDRGKSSFHFKNAEEGALAAFIEDVEKPNKLPRNPVLLVENADRIGRGKTLKFMGILFRLLSAGVRLVTLDDGRELNENSEVFDFFRIMIDQSRGQGESKRKNELVGWNWENWKKTGISRQNKGGGSPNRPGPVPFWISRNEDGTYYANEKQSVVKLIFQLAADGMGSQRISSELRKRKISPHISKKTSDGFLSQPYINVLLSNPIVYGRCEELDKDDYFPEVVSEDQFNLVQSVMKSRTRKGKRAERDRVNILGGLVEHFHTESRFITRRWKGTDKWAYYPLDVRSSKETESTCFPVEELEHAILDCVRELDANKVFGKDVSSGLEILFGQQAQLKDKITQFEKALDEVGEVAAIARKIKVVEAQLREVNEKIAEEKVKNATPLLESLTSFQQMKIGDLKDEETRIKVKTELGKVVGSIRVAFKNVGVWRMAYAVVCLKESDEFREVVCLYHRPLAGVVPAFYYAEGQQKFSNDITPAEPEAGFIYLQEIVDRVDAERKEQAKARFKEYLKTYKRPPRDRSKEK